MYWEIVKKKNNFSISQFATKSESKGSRIPNLAFIVRRAFFKDKLSKSHGRQHDH